MAYLGWDFLLNPAVLAHPVRLYAVAAISAFVSQRKGFESLGYRLIRDNSMAEYADSLPRRSKTDETDLSRSSQERACVRSLQ